MWVWVGVSAGVGSEGIASPHWPGAGHWGEGAGPTGGEGVDKGTLAPHVSDSNTDYGFHSHDFVTLS